MAGLFLHHRPSAATPLPAIAAAARQFGRHGFAPVALDFPGWSGLHAGYIASDLPMRRLDGDTLVAVAGTLTVDGRMGAEALALLPGAVTPRGPDWSRIAGQFVALVRTADRAFLFTDFFAAFPLYHDERRHLFSTSLLALVGACPRVAFDAQGIYEYAFNIAPTGDDTVFAGIKTLGPGTMIELARDGVRLHPIAKSLPDQTRSAAVADLVDRHRVTLAATVAPAVAHFGDHIRAPLSGGIDARLLLAALRREGSRPSVYVYGPATSADVRIARSIGVCEGFAVEWTDKRAGLPDADAFPAMVEAEFHALDALPNYGNIFDNGGNAAALAARHAGGVLATSGACGEVYRDFFYLPDRPFAVDAIARGFFARFDAGDATALFDPRDFLGRITRKIATALDAPIGPLLSRTLLEQAYPRIRCRALFGREASLEARYGPYLMPFLDHRIVAAALELPMPLKQAGRAEAALLTAIDPGLARHPSAYGHCFARPPGRRRRWREWQSRARPLWLRERSYALHRRLGPLADEHGGLTDPAWLSRVVDLEFPAMRRYFHVERIADAGLLRRVAALEYLAARLGSRLAD